MITVQSRFIYSLEGLSEEELENYKNQADEYEKVMKDGGTFWGRFDTENSITLICQTYLDIKK